MALQTTSIKIEDGHGSGMCIAAAMLISPSLLSPSVHAHTLHECKHLHVPSSLAVSSIGSSLFEWV
eukprot:3845081-Pyramimonas_sp.AAC.1